MMQELERASAVFCIACVCAELVSRFVRQGWGQKCIKAVAGLYILVVLAETLSGTTPQILLSDLPHLEPAAFGTMENTILTQAESELEAALADQCFQEAGVSVTLKITLVQTTEDVRAETVCIQFPGELSATQQQKITDVLTSQLQVSPECFVWEIPGGEAAP